MNEIEKTIKALKTRKWEHDRFGDITDYFDKAIQALQEKAERKSGCEYCKGGGCAKSLVDGETTIFITGDNEVFYADQGGDGYLDWKFCPMCGRKLVEE